MACNLYGIKVSPSVAALGIVRDPHATGSGLGDSTRDSYAFLLVLVGRYYRGICPCDGTFAVNAGRCALLTAILSGL